MCQSDKPLNLTTAVETALSAGKTEQKEDQLLDDLRCVDKLLAGPENWVKREFVARRSILAEWTRKNGVSNFYYATPGSKDAECFCLIGAARQCAVPTRPLHDDYDHVRAEHIGNYLLARLNSLPGWQNSTVPNFNDNPLITFDHVKSLVAYAIAYREWELGIYVAPVEVEVA